MSAAPPVPQSPPTTVPPRDVDPYESAWTVVLARTPRGEDEIRRPLMPLSRAQQDLLVHLDGKRSLRLLVAQRPTLGTARLSRNAARLLAFGLVRQVQGELPRTLVVEAMNLTMKLPAAAFAPRQPGDGASVIDTDEDDTPPPATPRRWALPLMALLAIAVVSGVWWLRG